MERLTFCGAAVPESFVQRKSHRVKTQGIEIRLTEEPTCSKKTSQKNVQTTEDIYLSLRLSASLDILQQRRAHYGPIP